MLTFLFPFLIVFQILIFGKLLKKQLFQNLKVDISVETVIAIFVISNVFFILNFIFSLNKIINSIIFILPLFFIFYIGKEDIKKILKYSILFSIFFILFVSFDTVNRPDAGLYHLPFISILNENKIIVGLANLHFRFGHTSILQYLDAGYNNFIFNEYGILIPKSILYFSLCYFFFKETIDNFKRNQNNFGFISFLILFQILFDMNRYSYHGNDVPAHLIILFLSYYFFKNRISKFGEFYLISSLCVFSFQIKSTSLVLLIMPILIIIFFRKKNYLFNFKNFFLVLLFSLWIIKNILISGCLIFPLKVTCIDKFYWNSSLIESENSVNKVSTENEAWAKGWPDRSNIDLNYEQYLKSNWTNIWIKNHGKILLKKLTPIMIITVLVSLVFFMSVKKYKFNKYQILKNLILFGIFFFGTIVWFMKFPTYRYGSSYIIGLIIFSQLYLSRNFEVSHNIKNSIKYISIFLIFLINLKYLQKYHPEKSFWPNIYSFEEKIYKPKQFKKIYKGEKFMFYDPEGKLCMYSASPCTNVSVNKKVTTKINSFGYKIYFLSFS